MTVPRYQPQLATLARVPPAAANYLHELKSDGWRGAVVVSSGRVRIVSRHARTWTDAFPTIVQAAQQLPLAEALLDGEIAVLMPNGLTSFQALQHRTSLPPGSCIVFDAFDLLYLDGRDLTRTPLEARKALLEPLLVRGDPSPVIRYVPHILGDGPRVLEHACALGAEGIVSKRRDSLHTPGRSSDWLKSKCLRREPFVVGGFIASRDGHSVSALLVGCHDAQGALHYAGNVGTGKGFNREFLRALGAQLVEIEEAQSPFPGFAPKVMRSPWSKAHAATVRWVKPVAVVEIAYLELSSNGQLRHASFQRFCPDLNARDVIRLA